MNLINNRYKVEEFLHKDNFEDYLVRDSFDKNNLKFMRIIDGEKNRELIEYYMNEFIWIHSIKHKKILNVESFGMVETINLKHNNLPLYYVVSDKHPSITLEKLYKNLNLQERIKVIQELIYTIDYLHFRGFAYKYLSPNTIFFSKEEGLKICSITSTIDTDYINTIKQLNEDFVAPSVLIKKDNNRMSSDYYSLAMIMRYLLLKENTDERSIIFLDDLNIKRHEKELLKNIINSLIKAYHNNEDLSLSDIIINLNKIVEEKFVFNFKGDREHLYFSTKLIGRDKELNRIDEIDKRMLDNSLNFNGLIIKGASGVGKTRLIKEFNFRLRNRRRTVFKVNVEQSVSYDLDIIRIFLNIVTDNVEQVILDRYRSNFIKYIPEKYNYDKPYINENSIQRIEMYNLFNSICNYLKEMSMNSPVYIMIDNIDKYNHIFINLVDFLLQSLFNSRVFIIFSYNNIKENTPLFYKINKWMEEKFIEEIKLENLPKKEIASLTQLILGMSFPPIKFASVLYDSSNGNPRFLDLIIKEIYNNKELYISDQGRWFTEKDNYTELSLPTDFKKTIIKQTKNITGDKLEVLKLISISNESLSKFIIFNMLDFDIKYLNSIINSLLDDQILIENSYDSNYYYGFLSNELKATVYHDIGDKEKKELHNHLARLFMEYKPKIIRDLVDEISYHLIRAGEREKAINVIVNEANTFENIYTNKAVALWEMAFSIVRDMDHEKKLEILERLTVINLHKSNIEKMKLYLDEYSKEAERLKDVKYIIKAKNYSAELYLRNNDIDKVHKTIEDIDKLSLENNYIEGKILSYTLNIRASIKDSEVDKLYIKEMLQKALNLSKKHNIITFLGKIYFQYGLFFELHGDPYESISYYDKSIKYLEEDGDLYETIKAINNLGNVCLERIGDKDKCFDYFQQGLEISNKYGFSYLESIFLHNLGEAYLNILEYKKAMEYTNKSISLAQANKDIGMIVISNCNMGRIYLLTNEYDKAYNIYTLIKNIFIKEMITDTEIITAYRNFLAEFYFNFGKYDLSIKYSNLVRVTTKDTSLNYYFKSIIRLSHIDYVKGKLNKGRLYEILEEYKKENIGEVYSWKLLVLISMSLHKNDYEFAKELMRYYNARTNPQEPELSKELSGILKLCLSDNQADLIAIEDKLNDIENKKDYNIALRLYIHLADRYKELIDYKKSMRYNIKAFDGIYKTVDSIENIDLRLSFVKNLDVQGIKDNINYILCNYYGMNIRSMDLEDVHEENFYEYFDLTPVIDSLTKKEINDIVSYQDDIGVDNADDLISILDGNYLNNIKLILKYLGKETLAQRGFILKFSDDKVNLEALVSLIENDTNLPNEMILLQSVRQKSGFIFNFNSQRHGQKKYTTYLPKNARGIICIPITLDKTHDLVDTINYSNIEKENVYGYIYLETDNAFNRFDAERSKLVYSLSKLIALNLENEKLRVNSTTDKLTSAYTRKFFDFKLESTLEAYRKKQGNLCVLMIDVDKFKNFNDKYGHLKGDEVLAQVALTIKSTINSKGIVGRYGGEEFIVLLLDCELDEAIEIGEEIRHNVEHTNIPGIEDNVTISVGLSQFPNHGSYKTELIENADQALYYAKEVLSRNVLVVWNGNMQGSNRSNDKTKGLITGNPEEVNRKLLQLMDIAESIKDNISIEDKIYQLLGSIITVSKCEIATFIQYKENKISKYYTRKREVTEWLEDSHIRLNLVNQVYQNKIGMVTIDWHDEVMDDFHIPDWDSVLIVPVIKEDIVEGILYATVPLKENEFNQDILNVINIFANIFSGNF